MSLSTTILCYIATVLVSLFLLPSTKAVPTPHDRDRAILAYNTATDLCSKLNGSSVQEEIDAADWSCWKAFVALDDIKGNSCNVWREARCRKISGQNQCSCKITTRGDDGVKGHVTKTFKSCALQELWSDTLFVGGLSTSARFRRASARIENELQLSRTLRKLMRADGSSQGAGPLGGGSSSMEVSYDSAPQVGSSSRGKFAAPSTGLSLDEAGRLTLPSTIHICEYCQKPYKSESSYLQHVRSHITRATTCFSCNRPFSTKSNYNAHMKLVHKQGTTAGRGRAPKPASTSEPAPLRQRVSRKAYGCEICGKVFKSAKLLRDHKIVHTEIFICRICNKSYTTPTIFEEHIQDLHPMYIEVGPIMSLAEVVYADSTSNPFVCNSCGTRYASDKSHRQHMRSHNSQLTTCTFCNITYSTLSSYHLHMRNQHPEDSPPTSEPGESSV